MAGSEVRMMSATDHVLDAVCVRRTVRSKPRAPMDVADVPAVEDQDAGEDREVAEHPSRAGPPRVQAACTFGGGDRHVEHRFVGAERTMPQSRRRDPR